MGYDADPPNKLKKICGARKEPVSDTLQFLCQWEGTEKKTLEYSTIVKSNSHEDALKIIEFFEPRLKFGKGGA